MTQLDCQCPNPDNHEHEPPCPLYTEARCVNCTVPLKVVEQHDGIQCTNTVSCAARVEAGPGWLLNKTGLTPVGYCTCDAAGKPASEHATTCPIAATYTQAPTPEALGFVEVRFHVTAKDADTCDRVAAHIAAALAPTPKAGMDPYLGARCTSRQLHQLPVSLFGALLEGLRPGSECESTYELASNHLPAYPARPDYVEAL